MGGQLGLWAGFSVLSLAELIELVMLLFHACCTARKTDVQSDKEDTWYIQKQNVNNECDNETSTDNSVIII